MLSLINRIELADNLGKYMLSGSEEWLAIQERAARSNTWFTLSDIETASVNIATGFLQKEKLEKWAAQYQMPSEAKTVGIVMAGNIPLVGFHDFLCGFISGHKLMLKLSSKDNLLITHLLNKLIEWAPQVAEQVQVAEMLKGCDAYIATGSNNTARYFEQYFGKYPNIIRKNRTSVAVLDGTETELELNDLAKDVFTYFGLGCRNVSQLCVPLQYDFSKLLDVFKSYESLIGHHKFKNNYDYYLAIYLLNKIPYLTNGSILLRENDMPFSPVAVLHYRYYNDKETLMNELKSSNEIQCVLGRDALKFGTTQTPSLSDYADGIDTMQFLSKL